MILLTFPWQILVFLALLTVCCLLGLYLEDLIIKWFLSDSMVLRYLSILLLLLIAGGCVCSFYLIFAIGV